MGLRLSDRQPIEKICIWLQAPYGSSGSSRRSLVFELRLMGKG
jgi:hypothetical protein